MITLDHIRPYHDSEVNQALLDYMEHPMIMAMLQFTFPQKSMEEIVTIVKSCRSIRDFQTKIIYNSVRMVLDKSSEGLTTSGFEKLQTDESYLFISNHRDIILDTSLLNVALYDHNLVMTASAIGDNLVKKPFLMALSKLNRSFLIMRNLPPREMLGTSKLVSEYIQKLLLKENRSVWIAQREGRTKDGNDKTQQGVLKMLALANDETEQMDYFKKLKIVPVSISYEFDPTDVLKMPELMAKHHDIEYVKSSNEDFNSILKGATGKKKRIHVSAGKVISNELDIIKNSGEQANGQLQMLAELLDKAIHKNYKLWPSNYLAYDMLHNTQAFKKKYTIKEKRQFERRIKRRVEANNKVALHNFLKMYATPVTNCLNYDEEQI
ncbi:1-acyl-sn-glycerol-3-phosphate acyltransferase [Galbibacter pacificus]|uniref:1-acyl-sn-glycerol-3-phosphate acyltransferase n=1 Tax=Galbibacter pacificus TaxID=2996052 RepID=A0ABT6FTL3_9FLAO|nr:1-acyl-sn-glycerol-3-phosphate acyltransferase [Galbibacter pacificus]MDG3583105.1 1-acyl-sn-glycerol-3-phosphate acyltransferase [Galbibacter pacificus]MDG3586586.1 1-acyl-sn-glycerol-3-phosphate acyltransferase [Galbibacter pacificus]